jgi:acyl carrier protein
MQKNDQFNEVFNTVNEIFKDVLENEDIVLQYETTASDVEEWDSLNHIALVVAIEKKFGIQFTAKEIQDFKNVGEMCDGIVQKLQGKA